METIQVDVCLLGTSGLSESIGPTAYSYQELSVKRDGSQCDQIPGSAGLIHLNALAG